MKNNSQIYKSLLNDCVLEAKKSLKSNDIPVGALVYDLKSQQIIAKAHNKREKLNNIIKHAEIIAIEKANKKLNTWHLNNHILVVSLEPCLMCIGAIMDSRIKEIVIGCKKEKDSYLDNTYIKEQLAMKNIKITYLENKDSQTTIQKFFKEIRSEKNAK